MRPFPAFTVALVLLAMSVLLMSPCAVAQQETVLYSFDDRTHDGTRPVAGLVRDTQGNLYGTTQYGGAHGCGVVFELIPNSGGDWTEKILHDFNHGGKDGCEPASSLILDAAGNLYGTTVLGGTDRVGTVFEFTPAADGTWTESLLHSFKYDGADGNYPYSGLTLDPAGNLFGTTVSGGTYNSGTAFRLAHSGSGAWRETVIHSFSGGSTDAIYTMATLVLDKAGNLYGASYDGGAYGDGLVFELSPAAGGEWTETVPFTFGPIHSGVTGPNYSLSIDGEGNLYGTTYWSGGYNLGSVFELSPKAGGRWTESVLHSFNTNDGQYPLAPPLLDAEGRLYCTGSEGGFGVYGTAIELTLQPDGRWAETLLHAFGNGEDGQDVVAGLISDASGNLYGTTELGGTYGFGTVFEIVH
jgi:uncharacterized repeat protein (TIGR03803 family)